MGKASFQRTVIDITKKHGIHDKVLFGVNRQQASGVSSTSSIGTGGGSSVAPVTGFLKVSGGSMLGPIAYYPATKALSASTIDISSTGAYSSTVYLIVSADGNLDTISGAVNAGQRLTLYNGSVHTVTIRDSTVSGSNITVLPYGTSYSLGPLGKIDLFFDAGLQKWNVLATVSPASSGANTSLSNLTNPTSVSQSLIPQNSNVQNLGTVAKVWSILYINTIQIEDSTDPTGKFTDIAYNTTTHYLEYSQTIPGITAGQLFVYNTLGIFAPCEGDNTFSDVAYVGFYQNHVYTSATAGTASALPAKPVAYIIVRFNGTRVKIPVYNI